MNGLYYVYAHDELAGGGISPKAHYIGTVFAASPAAALKKAKRNRDWQAVYTGFRLERPTDSRRNPAGIRAQGTRITKKEWQALGGLSNPHLWRRQSSNGSWRYYKESGSWSQVKANPAGIRAQVRRLPSGQIQLKIPLKSNPVLFEDIEGKPLVKRLDKLRRYGDHMLKGGQPIKEVGQRLRSILGKIMDHATITVDDGKGNRVYNPRPFYTIKKSDVGKATIKAFGKRWRADEFIGHIGAYDVGKQVVQTSPGVLQVENDQQLQKRLGTRNPEAWKWQGPWVVLIKSQSTGEAINSLSATFPTEGAARIYRSNLISRGLHRGRIVELLHNTGTNAPGGVKVVSSKSY